jgi:hypothetical protein
MWLRRLVELGHRLSRNPVSHWCLLFLVLAVTVDNHNNNANPYARFATLMAVAEDHSLAIDVYQGTTCDWARTPDGRYYSNKAPGPTLMALPFYLPMDALVVAHAKDRKLRDALRLEGRAALLDYLAIGLQAIPFALLVMLAASLLAARGVSRPAIELCALAMLFGNTASLLMNMYYGHGTAAVLTLGLAFALLDRRLFLAGLLFGLDVLTDYGTALFLPILLAIVLVPSGRDIKTGLARLGRFALGGLGPLLVFAAYHAYCFGGPFTLPNKYQNPVFVDTHAKGLWGVINFLPSPSIAYELLFGAKRGLLVTQPWVLLLAALLLPWAWLRRGWTAQRREATRLMAPLAFGGFLVLFAMNASFGGWHGGVCPGPRYLGAILPLLGFVLGLCYDTFPKPVRIALWLSVLPALALFIIIWAGDPAIWPQHEIWVRCKDVLFKIPSAKTRLRLAWMVFAFAVTAVVAVLRARWEKTSRGVTVSAERG